MKPWQMGESFLWWNKVGVLQYVIVKTTMASVTILLIFNGSYHEVRISLISLMARVLVNDAALLGSVCLVGVALQFSLVAL